MLAPEMESCSTLTSSTPKYFLFNADHRVDMALASFGAAKAMGKLDASMETAKVILIVKGF